MTRTAPSFLRQSIALATALSMTVTTMAGCVSTADRDTPEAATISVLDGDGGLLDEQQVAFDRLWDFQGPTYFVDGVETADPAALLDGSRITLPGPGGDLVLQRTDRSIAIAVTYQGGGGDAEAELRISWSEGFDVVTFDGPASDLRYELDGIEDPALARHVVGGLILSALLADPAGETQRIAWVPVLIGVGVVAGLLGYTYWTYSGCMEAARAACTAFMTTCLAQCSTCKCEPKCSSTLIVQWEIENSFVAEGCRPPAQAPASQPAGN